MGYEANAEHGGSYEKTFDKGTVSRQKKLSQESIDKLIYDALSADKGLAQLVSGEGLAGGRSSSTTTLMAQDFMSKVIADLGTVLAEDVQTTNMTSATKAQDARVSGGAKGTSVICTELMLQGKLDRELHSQTHEHWLDIHIYTKQGYWAWATKVVLLMKKSERLSAALAPVAVKRCEMIATGKFNLLGAATIYIGQPVCFVIGAILSMKARHGSTQLAN